MRTIYQVTGADFDSADFVNIETARAFVEKFGSGRIVAFRIEKNAPFCLPEYVERSFAMWRFHNGQWRAFDIHGGTASWEEVPESRD